MGRLVDSLITFRILKMLVTPFDKTDAFRFGIIDAKGKILKSESDLHTSDEREAYTLLHRLVFRLKRIIEKVPVENKHFLSIAAAYALIHEHYETGEPIDLELQFINKLKEPLTEEVNAVKQFSKQRMTFAQFCEDAAMAPANTTTGIAGIGTDEPPGPKAILAKKIIRRKDKNEKSN